MLMVESSGGSFVCLTVLHCVHCSLSIDSMLLVHSSCWQYSGTYICNGCTYRKLPGFRHLDSGDIVPSRFNWVKTCPEKTL